MNTRGRWKVKEEDRDLQESPKLSKHVSNSNLQRMPNPLEKKEKRVQSFCLIFYLFSVVICYLLLIAPVNL